MHNWSWGSFGAGVGAGLVLASTINLLFSWLVF